MDSTIKIDVVSVSFVLLARGQKMLRQHKNIEAFKRENRQNLEERNNRIYFMSLNGFDFWMRWRNQNIPNRVSSFQQEIWSS